MSSLAPAGGRRSELISQLFHADVLITEQAERNDAVGAEVARLRATVGDTDGVAA